MDNKYKTVTIITPVYNNKDDIVDAIDSVVNQTYRYWEYIIVDDCSKDGTFELLESYLKKLNNEKIKLIRNSKNKGTYVSINKALKRCKSDFFCLLGSDDTFDSKKLEKQVEKIQINSKIMVCDAWYKRSNKIVENNVASSLYRTSLIKEIGYFDSVRFGADSEYKHRIYKKFGKKAIIKIDEVLYYAKIRANSLTRSKDTGRRDVRQKYTQTFKKWHTKAMKKNSLYIKFPLKSRPFNVDPIMLPNYTPINNKYKNRKRIENQKKRRAEKKNNKN
jgi:glycosyltransferase involved in cell wall biosynthesis